LERAISLRQSIKLIMVNLKTCLTYLFLIFADKKTNSQFEEYHNGLTHDNTIIISLLILLWLGITFVSNEQKCCEE
jgi:hypothetical protein